MSLLIQHQIPFVVGGAYAFSAYTGICRDTKDLDLMCKRDDIDRVAAALSSRPYRFESTYPHWLAKIFHGDQFVDLIHNSGNGVAPVDDDFFTHARRFRMLDMDLPVCPVEELIWSKAFIMERERFDGADVAHLLHVQASSIDWRRLLDRFGVHFRVLLAHLIILGYVYPHETNAVPRWVMETLLRRVQEDRHGSPSSSLPICAGTLVSRQQYLVDILRWGYLDGRLASGVMSEDEIQAWTQAIQKRK